MLVQIVVALAHPQHDGLLGTVRHGARSALGPVADALAAPDGHPGAALGLALLPGRAVTAAKAGLLDVLGTAGVGALLPLGPVGDAQSPLHDAVGTSVDGALAPDAGAAAASTARCASVMGGLLDGSRSRSRRRRRGIFGTLGALCAVVSGILAGAGR